MAMECPPGEEIYVSDFVDELNRKSYKDTWHYLYYADEEIDRVLGMDTVTMTQKNTIELGSLGSNAGSVDRAGYTDKLYVRTAGYDHVDVLDAISGEYLRSIPLIHHPRSSGGYNRYRGLQVISTKVMRRLLTSLLIA